LKNISGGIHEKTGHHSELGPISTHQSGKNKTQSNGSKKESKILNGRAKTNGEIAKQGLARVRTGVNGTLRIRIRCDSHYTTKPSLEDYTPW
jgi:hypothetical protein